MSTVPRTDALASKELRKHSDGSNLYESALAEWEQLARQLESELTSLKSTLAETQEENKVLEEEVMTARSNANEWMRKNDEKAVELSKLLVEFTNQAGALAETRAKLADSERERDNFQESLGIVSGEAAHYAEHNLSLTAALKTAREALEFYATKWYAFAPDAELLADEGERAKTALSAIRGEE